MNRNSVPRNGNHLAAIESGMFPRVMLSRISENSTSTAVWTLFGRACMRPAIHTIVKIVSTRRDEQVEHGAVDAEHAEADPVDELELVLDLELVVLVLGEAVDHDQQDEHADVERRRRSAGSCGSCSSRPRAGQEGQDQLRREGEHDHDEGRQPIVASGAVADHDHHDRQQEQPAEQIGQPQRDLASRVGRGGQRRGRPRRRPRAARSRRRRPTRYPTAGTPISSMIGAATTSRTTSR